MCKLQPEILINIVKYPLIVKMYNQCIFYNIKNFWLKLKHCENKSWKKLCPSFLNCKLSTILQHFFNKILGRIFFPPAGPFSFITKINRLPDVALTDNSTNTELVSMFVNDTML